MDDYTVIACVWSLVRRVAGSYRTMVPPTMVCMHSELTAYSE